MGASLLRTRDLCALLGAMERLHQPVEPADFPAHLFGILADLLPGALASFDFVELSTGKTERHPTSGPTPAAPVMGTAARPMAPRKPVAGHGVKANSAAAIQPANLISRRAFRRVDLCNVCFLPLSIEYQIAAGVTMSGHAGGLIINRPESRNFTAREREMVRQLRPHVERAFANSLLIADLRQRTQSAGAALAAKQAAPEFDPAGLRARGLTRRETEVLHWLREGKRDAEIAVILSISPRTVGKHVEHLFAKLGVETRTAAAAAAVAR